MEICGEAGGASLGGGGGGVCTLLPLSEGGGGVNIGHASNAKNGAQKLLCYWFAKKLSSKQPPAQRYEAGY